MWAMGSDPAPLSYSLYKKKSSHPFVKCCNKKKTPVLNAALFQTHYLPIGFHLLLFSFHFIYYFFSFVWFFFFANIYVAISLDGDYKIFARTWSGYLHNLVTCSDWYFSSFECLLWMSTQFWCLTARMMHRIIPGCFIVSLCATKPSLWFGSVISIKFFGQVLFICLLILYERKKKPFSLFKDDVSGFRRYRAHILIS